MKSSLLILTTVLCAAFARAETSVVIETAPTSSGFKELSVPSASQYGQPGFGRRVTANHSTNNEPLSVLTDGRLAEDFGPIFGNDVDDGVYKMDLGAVRSVSAITSWSHNQVGRRGAQKLTVFASDAATDPGWDLSHYTELATVDTGKPNATFTAASLRDSTGASLGSFRWIVWAVTPSAVGENTAYQEFAVDAEPTQQERAFAAVKRPNIVFLLTDDQRWDMLGCYGRTDVITPNIDKLAAEGVTFDNAYYAVAICMPSRATMFTGRYFSDHRSGFTYPYNRTLSKEEFAESYPAKLKEVGYRTGFVGKFGIRLEGSSRGATDFFDYFVSGNNPVVPKNDLGLKEIYRKGRPANERTLKKGDAMIRFLETQPEGQPFCLSISFDAVKNDRDSDMYPPDVKVLEGMPMWVPDNYVEGKNLELPELLDHCRGTYLHVARTGTPEQYQVKTRRFAVQGYTVDNQVGRLIEKLEEMGVMDNTIIVYTSDNGRFHGSHGLFDKAILYDEAMKEPLIIYDGRAAANGQRGSRVNAMVSSADVAPTIVSLAGLEAPKAMKGVDLSDLLKGTQDMSQWRDTVLMENFFLQEIHRAGGKKHPDISGLNDEILANNRSYRTQGVRTERFKYFKYHEHDPVIEELYDMQNDPYEMKNLVNNPEYATVLADLRKRTGELISAATK
ncbi:MAG: sulfatase-like hydrolase/transferase [Opitutaceae bacterium]